MAGQLVDSGFFAECEGIYMSQCYMCENIRLQSAGQISMKNIQTKFYIQRGNENIYSIYKKYPQQSVTICIW